MGDVVTQESDTGVEGGKVGGREVVVWRLEGMVDGLFACAILGEGTLSVGCGIPAGEELILKGEGMTVVECKDGSEGK